MLHLLHSVSPFPSSHSSAFSCSSTSASFTSLFFFSSIFCFFSFFVSSFFSLSPPSSSSFLFLHVLLLDCHTRVLLLLRLLLFLLYLFYLLFIIVLPSYFSIFLSLSPFFFVLFLSNFSFMLLVLHNNVSIHWFEIRKRWLVISWMLPNQEWKNSWMEGYFCSLKQVLLFCQEKACLSTSFVYLFILMLHFT